MQNLIYQYELNRQRYSYF